MRWSWPSFAAGLTLGALLAALWWMASADDPEVYLFEPGQSDRAADADADAAPDIEAAGTAAAETPHAETAGDEREPEPEPETAPRVRVRVDPSTGGPGEPGDTVSTSSGSFEFVGGRVENAPLKGRIVSVEGGVRFEISGDFIRIVRAAATSDAVLSLAHCQAAARAILADGTELSRSLAEDLLSADDYATRAAGVGIASMLRHRGRDLLLAAARDASYPSLRPAALQAAVSGTPNLSVEAADAADAVLELSRDTDVNVRQVAVGALHQAGERGARRALDLARAGDHVPEEIGALASAIVKHGLGEELLGAGAAPALTLAVLRQMITGTEGAVVVPHGDVSGPTVAERLPDLARGMLEHDSAEDIAEPLLDLLAVHGNGTFLRDVASSAAYPHEIRVAAVDAALGKEGLRGDGVAGLLTIVSDARVPAAVARDIVAKLTAGDVQDAAVSGALWSVATSHASAWVRHAAERKLREAGVGGGALVIHSAEYGAKGETIDVSAALRRAVEDGRLEIGVGNDLGGDPMPGTMKQLTVDYTYRGERYARVVNEYSTLSLP